MPDAKQYAWMIERQIHYPQINEAEPAPDGRSVLYVVREPLMTDDKSEFVTQLYLASAGGGDPQQLTFGQASNSSPRWSPDGRYIAFLSKRSGKNNLFVMRAGGGEAWALTRYEKTDLQSLLWSHDGQQIAFTMAEPPTEQKEKDRKARNDPLQWEVDFEFTHLFVVPFAVGPRTPPEPRQVTQGRFQVIGYDWLSGDSGLAFCAQPSPVADTWVDTWLATISLSDGAEPQRIATVAAWGAAPMVSPDGRWIACPTSDGPPRWAFASRITLFPTGKGEPRILAETPDYQPNLLGWSPDSSRVYINEAIGVNTQIYALPVSGELAQALTSSPSLKTGIRLNGNYAAWVGEDFDRPNAVYLSDLTGSETPAAPPVATPQLPGDWPSAALPRTEIRRWQSPDGREIEGIVTYPLGYQEGTRYPLVVSVHGGPTGVFQRSFLGSPAGYGHVCGLAERGFATLRVNPRGSSGYGREFRFANYDDWGGGDFQDILSGVDDLITSGVVDPEKLGIMGWSYGGFMASWAITQTNRFKAACIGAAVTNLMSFNGTADIPGFIPDYFSGEFWDDLEAYRTHSALFQIKGATTPSLIQHGDSDIRVPLSQGRELYNALKRQGVATEMIIYPRQGHLFHEPRLIIDVRKRAVEWFERYLIPE